ncbi:MAG: hypothetical protein RLZZ232_698 [Planctomycetota bacterium]
MTQPTTQRVRSAGLCGLLAGPAPDVAGAARSESLRQHVQGGNEKRAHRSVSCVTGKGGAVNRRISSKIPLLSPNFRKKSQGIIFPDSQVRAAILFGLVAQMR